MEAQLREAAMLQRVSRLQEAAEIYERLCRDNPEHAEAHRLFGRLSWDLQQPDRALELLTRAAALAPGEAQPHLDLAEIHAGLGRQQDAEIALKEATLRDSSAGDPFVKLALLSLQQKNRAQARDYCATALEREPGLMGAHQLMSYFCWEEGALEDAARHGLAARQALPPGPDPHGSLAACLFALGRGAEIATLAPAPSDGQSFIETVLQALAAWQAGDSEACARHVAAATALDGRLEDAPGKNIYLPFLPPLDAYLKFRSANPALYQTAGNETPLYAVGDNHCLMPGGLVIDIAGLRHRVTTSLTVGCRAGHLAQPDDNLQRNAFAAALARAPEGAKILVSLGEIDCRYREGLLPYLRNNSGLDPDEIVIGLVKGCVDRVLAIAAERGQQVLFLVPPARNFRDKDIASTDRDLYLRISVVYAAALSETAAARGCPVVDLFTLTRDNEGQARQELYIDRNHVLPSVFLDAVAQMKF